MRRFLTMAAALLLGGLSACSFQATLDKMVSRERQEVLVSIAKRFCTDPASITGELHAEIAASVSDAAPQLPHECVGADATWQLASYQWNTNVANGLRQRQEEVVVVGIGKGKWSTISLRLYAENDAPMKIILWNVLGSTTKPPALHFVENFDKTAGIMRMALPILLLLVAALAIGLVWHRRRRKRVA